MASPRTPRLHPLGMTNYPRAAEQMDIGSHNVKDRRSATNAPVVEITPRSPRVLSARGPPRLSAVDRVRDMDEGMRALTTRSSAGNEKLRHGNTAPNSPVSPIRSVMLPLAPVPEFVPEVSNMRVQDIVPEYERANPLYVKLDDTYRRLCENKSELVKIFMELDPKKHGFLSRREFAEGIKRTNQKCKLNIPRVLLDDMCEEAGTMFAPKRDPQDPQNIVYYEQFIAALQAPSPIAERTLEQALEASSPARLMAPTSRFTERARRSEDFTMIERMKAHVIQNDLRTLLALRKGLDPGSGTRETFLRLDADRDGIIGKEDLRQNSVELGMPINNDSMELILSYCDNNRRGGIDFTSFVKHFEANGRGWFNPFNPHKRLPSPPFRPRADQTSPAFAKTPASRDPPRLLTATQPLLRPTDPGWTTQGYALGPDLARTQNEIKQRRNRTDERRVKVVKKTLTHACVQIGPVVTQSLLMVMMERNVIMRVMHTPAYVHQARRRFKAQEEVRKERIRQAQHLPPPYKIEPMLAVDYKAVVAADVERQRASMVY